jgi:hypothetical protein
MSSVRHKHTLIRYLPLYGCIATGIIYGAIGVIAMLSFLKIRHGGADESSILAILDDYLIGKIFIWIILLGTVAYIAWRFYETITDPYGYGKEVKGIAKRTGVALSTVADLLIVYAAVRVLLGNYNYQADGQPIAERDMVSHLLQWKQGKWLVMSIGVIYAATAVVQLLYGITRGYKERVDIDHFPPAVRHTVHVLAWLGYGARGLILDIIGFFFIKAAWWEEPRYIVNTDKAFDFIGDRIGHVYFVIVAIGTICYGLFMVAQGFSYDTDKD